MRLRLLILVLLLVTGAGAAGYALFGGSARGASSDSGQTVQVPLDSSTAYHREAGASASDVQPDTRVLVRLQAGSGGGGVQTGQLPPASDVTIVGQ